MDHSRILHEFLRASDVQRWNMVRTVRKQSLAEHSFNVAMIARNMAIHLGFSAEKVNEVAVAGLMHDLDEVFTGDIPSVTKTALRSKGFDWGQMEELPKEESEDVKIIVKCADFLEAMWFLRDSLNNSHTLYVNGWIAEEFVKFQNSMPKEYAQALLDTHHDVFRTDFGIKRGAPNVYC